MAHQLSVFVVNQPGKLERITKILADQGINIKSFSIASVGEFGVVKIIANDTEKAFDVLKRENVLVSKRKILIAVVPDQPGGLHNLLAVLSANAVNIEDCYGFVLENRKEAAIVLEVEKHPRAEEILRKHGIRILADDELQLV